MLVYDAESVLYITFLITKYDVRSVFDVVNTCYC